MTKTIEAKCSVTLDSIGFSDGRRIFVGQEATIKGWSLGGDSYPAKVEAIRCIGGGFEIDLRHYQFHADQSKSLGVGHQDWIIDWDKPGLLETIRIDSEGKKRGKSTDQHFTLGHARVYRCWEF